MTLLRLLTLRSIRTRPIRLLLSAFGIILGVAGILAIGITNQTALESITRLFENTSGKANLVVTAAEVETEGFKQQIAQKVAGFPGISLAVPSIQIQTILADEAAPSEIGLSFFGTSMGGLSLYGIDPRLDQEVREYNLTAGRFLEPDSSQAEVVLVENYAAENEIEIGDAIEIVGGNQLLRLRVVGLIAREGPGQLNNGAFGVIPLEYAQKVFYRDGKIDQIDLIVEPEFRKSADLEAIKTSLQNYLGEAYSVIFPAAQGKQMTQMLGNYQIGLNFMSGMAIFVGAFLIYNAFSMTVIERTREFGLLRTIGFTRSQVTRQVMSEAMVLGIFSSLLGVVLGIQVAQGLASMMGSLLSQTLTIGQVPRDLIATGLVVGVVATFIAAAIPAIQAGRISPLEALRIRALAREGWLIRHGWWFGLLLLIVSTIILIINPFPYDVQFRLGSLVVFSLFFGGTLMIPVTVGLWERILRPFIRLLYGSSGQIGSSNIQRARMRTTLTVAALMIGVAMIIVVWAMTGSFKGDLDEWLQGYIGGDLYVTSSVPMRADVWKRLQALEGVAAVAPVRYFEVDWIPPGGDKEKISAMGIDPASYTQVTSFVFSKSETVPQQALNRLAAGSSIFISSVISEKYRLKPGDSVSLVTRSGPRDFEVAGIVVDFYNQGMVIDVNWADMNRYFRQKDANTYLVKVEPGIPPDLVRQRIDVLYGKRDHLTVESNQAILSRISALMQQAFSLFDILAVIAIMVGFFGITNTMTMNVIERTQEIGMLRGVGMTRGQVLRMILAEAGIMGVIGGLIGLAFGVILSHIFLQAMTAMSGYSISYALPNDRIWLAMLIAIVVANLAAILPAARAARVKILEAIQYE
jgi:putative ABC transport system permease protein